MPDDRSASWDHTFATKAVYEAGINCKTEMLFSYLGN